MVASLLYLVRIDSLLFPAVRLCPFGTLSVFTISYAWLGAV